MASGLYRHLEKNKGRGSRAYALEPWVHMFVLEIKPDMVTTKDLKPVAPSKYEAYDLPVNGPSKWEVVEGGDIQATVKGPLGPANFKLIPIALDNKDWYISEMKKAGLDPPSDYYDTSPPGYDPTPPGYEPTPPGYDPGPPGDDPIDDPVLPGPPGEEPGIQPIPKPKPLPKPRPIVIPGDVTPDCGGDGQIICTTKPAYRAGKAAKLGCPGKNLHFSPRNGGECWSCPSGYKRTLNFITSKKACTKKAFKGPYSKATFVRSVWGCPAGQFHIAKNGGTCMACPKGYKRVHAAGADTLVCKVEKKYKCDGPLVVANLPPEKNPFANIFGFSRTKVCGQKFDIAKEAAKDSVDAAKVAYHMNRLKDDVLKYGQGAFAVYHALKDKNWNSAWQHLQGLDSYQDLLQAAREAEYRSITVGLAGDVQIILGANTEYGIAIDVYNPTNFRGYNTTGFSKGIAAGADLGVAVGLWRGELDSLPGPSQGIATSVGATYSGGAGVWYSYYTPETIGQQYLGLTVTGGGGIGFEVGEYDEVYTIFKD